MQWSEFSHSIRHLSANDVAVVRKAYELGMEAHKNQKRKSGEPYFTHPIAVAVILADMGADAETITAALLHDTVEDTDVTLSDLEKEFGPTVAALVDGVTKLSKEHIENKPSLDEKIESLRKMFVLMQEDIRIIVIKLADRLHNMRTTKDLSEEKKKRLAKETMQLYAKLAEQLCMRTVRLELEAACHAILNPEQFKKLEKRKKHNRDIGAKIRTEMQHELDKQSPQLMKHVELKTEDKKWDDLISQLKTEGAATGISDVTIDFVCNTIDDCYRTIGALHQLWQRESLSFQDYINAPMISGYQGVHTTIILPSGKRIRCKIRTQEMDNYAFNGITTICFDPNKDNGDNPLPWTQNISSLTEDTKNRSNEFRESLQNDILGKNILIHGSDDRTFMLPEDSTALDAAFYMYNGKALETKEIFVNGKKVAFSEPLKNGETVHANFARSKQANIHWLDNVTTGNSIATIRSSLSKEKETTKHSKGKQMLEAYFIRNKRGFIKELNVDSVQTLLQKYGYSSIDDVYAQIAEGRTRPEEIERILFQTDPKKNNRSYNSYRVHCIIDTHQQAKALTVLNDYKMKQLRVHEMRDNKVSMKATVHLLKEEHDQFTQKISDEFGATCNIRKQTTLYKNTTAAITLAILWGLDPVVAHDLLQRPDVMPIDLTFMRFVVQAVGSGLFFWWIRSRHALPENRIKLKNFSLWVSAVLLFFVGLTSYFALQNTLPAYYTIPMTCAGLLITTTNRRLKSSVYITTWVLVAIGVGVLAYFSPTWDTTNIALTLLAVATFSAFTIISERYKRTEEVSLRSAQYFFILSSLSTLFCVPLIFFINLGNLSLQTFALILLFSIVISGLPYYIYYYLLSHREVDFIVRYSFLLIPITIIGQTLFIGSINPYILLAALIVMVGAFLPVLYTNKLRKN